MKSIQLILSALAAIALSLVACKSEGEKDAATDPAPKSDTPAEEAQTPASSDPFAAPPADIQTVSLKIEGMT
ncbi:MAG: hypothetical protein ACSHYF_11570 [Verrucomicrobiaceae bacterium]